VIAGVGMYRLISASLVVLMLLAIGSAAVGLIGYTPQGIAVTALLAVASTALTSLMGAGTTRSIAHLESSVITGLLIAFIVPPTLETRDLLGVSAAGAIAGLSKYLLVFRGRHILNPAATGVTLAGFLGLTAGFWWVATPPLTPFIVLAGAMIAWRSGLGVVALTGLGVGVAAVLVRLVISGENVVQSFYFVVTSYPIVFLALFMLTEPLTMAPRRRAQLLVAVIVGLGTALPFSIPVGGTTLYSSPELVLLVGNLVAWSAALAVPLSRSADLTLVGSEPFGQKGLLLRFSLKKPLLFRAGQWVELHFPHRSSDKRGQRRVFSVVSAPSRALGDSPVVEIATTLAEPGSSFKHALTQAPLTSGARVSNLGGDFLLPKNPDTPILMIAGGIGITPFVSQLEQVVTKGKSLDTMLVEVRSAGSTHPFDEVITRSGVSHHVLGRDELEDFLVARKAEFAHRHVMVSGSPGFIQTTRKILRGLGIRRIHTDSFTGY
jgi:ferredoxin-NADP reductase